MVIRNFKSRETTEWIVIHCTGTKDDIGAAEIRRKHLSQGYLDIGYHYVIRLDGRIEAGRLITAPSGFDPKDSVAICCVGEELLTPEQALSLRNLTLEIAVEYPRAFLYPKSKLKNISTILGGPIGTSNDDHSPNHAPFDSHSGIRGSEPSE